MVRGLVLTKFSFHSHTGAQKPCGRGGLRRSSTRLSDRMSRSEMAVLLPSPLTASQVMITDIVDGIVETKILHVLAVCSEWAGWALLVAAAVWHSIFLVYAVVLVVRLTMVLAATTPRLPTRMAAQFCEFDGPSFSSPMGDAPVAVCGWHGQDTAQARPR